jgi:hypothetical protein
MRGIVTQENDSRLIANSDADEYSGADRFDLTSTGFRPRNNQSETNASGATYIYMAIRRPDGYVGKPPELGTGVFAMDTGNGSSTIPTFDSGFPVDFAFFKVFGGSGDWWTSARLTQGKYLRTNTSAAEGTDAAKSFDSNTGHANDSGAGSNYQSWMWKRHAGFDVVTYNGNGTAGHQIPHSLSKTPEMIWTKRRDSTGGWFVYHKGLDGGNQPETHYLYLNLSDAEGDQVLVWNDTAPTSSRFTVGSHSDINANNGDYMAMLFASVSGISSVGSYSGSSSDVTVTTGFTPRFVIVRQANGSANWYMFDTLRGLHTPPSEPSGGVSGGDYPIKLNDSAAQSAANTNYIDTTATGFVLKAGASGEINGGASDKYIYYAHA